jgi:uncharacterized protein (UPF0335 family)
MSEVLSDFTGQVAPKSVEIGGVRFALKEFDMRTRAMWLDVANEFKLPDAQHEIQSKVIPKISGVAHDIQSDPRIKSVEKRIQRLLEKHDGLLDLYATDDEPEDIEEQLEALVKRMEEQHEELAKLTDVVQDEVFQEAQKAEKAITEFMELQDKARVYFAWQIASALGKTGMEFDEFHERCDGDDFEAAERLVLEGNARWASLYSNRMQKKPSKKLLN